MMTGFVVLLGFLYFFAGGLYMFVVFGGFLVRD